MQGEVVQESGEESELRERLIGTLLENGTIVSPGVEAAMRAVPRHVFVPEVSAEVAYGAFDAVVTKRDEHNNAVSSVSAPQVQAFMLEQAEIAQGMRVLEIGSGGYNAALLAELVGPEGQVTTIDIDREIIDRARRLLDAAGYHRVDVMLADAEDGLPQNAPYDRILVTAGAWDIPPVWTDQLTPDGLLLVPLRMRGLTRTLALEFEHKPTDAGGPREILVSRSSRLFGFVPVQGRGAHQGTLLIVRDGEITLRFDDDHDVDAQLIQAAFRTPRVEVWTGVRIGRSESLDTLQMWLASVAPGFCTIVVDPARDTGLISPPGKRSFALAAVSGDSLAYVTTRATTDDAAVEFGVHAFGSTAAALADTLTQQLRTWDRDHRSGPGPRVHVYPAGTPDAQLPSAHVVHFIDKRHRRIAISWPNPTSKPDRTPSPEV